MAKLTVHRVGVIEPRLGVARSSADTPMRWAVRLQSGLAVHVSQLSRQETGLACQCICPSCRSALQAVNAGVDREHFLRANTLGQFFRHQGSEQRDSCLTAVARLTALQLLVERQEIDLPAPTRKATVQGISGEIYQGVAMGERSRLRVRKRVWIDSMTASLTLEDGHVILVRLEAERTVAEMGHFDGIITIIVDDPDVASWDAAEVLAKIQFDDGRSVCWNRHWADEDLQRIAQQDAEHQAAKYLDLLPTVLGDPAGLTPAQKSESVLHHAIKGILLKAKAIGSPVHREQVQQRMPDGETRTRQVVLDLGELRLSDAQSERVLAGLVADVHCHAQSKSSSFDLVIEVAVTHRVDSAKLERLAAIDMPCLEIDVRGFNRRGRTTLEDLTNEVLNNAANKRWLHHPLIASKRNEALQALEQQAAGARHAIESAKRADQWLDSLAREALLRAFKEALLQHWQGTAPLVVSGHSVELAAIADRLAKVKLFGANEQSLWDRGGVIYFLYLSKARRTAPSESDVLLYDLLSALANSIRNRSLITYCLMGLRVFKPMVLNDDGDQLKKLRKHIMKLLESGDSTFARSGKFDSLIGALFPQLRDKLNVALGTQAHVRLVQAKKRADLEASYAVERAAHAVLQKKLREQAVRQEIASAIEMWGKKDWNPKLGLASDVDQIMGHENVKQSTKFMHAAGFDIHEVLTSAWEAREQGVPKRDWMKARSFTDADQVRVLARFLATAWLA